MGDRILSISKVEPMEFIILREMWVSLKSYARFISLKNDVREVDQNASNLK